MRQKYPESSRDTAIKVVTVSPNVETLGASFFERSADSGAMSVDGTGEGIVARALKNTPVFRRHPERELTEVTRLQALDDIIVPPGPPFRDIVVRDEDGAVSCLTTRAAVEAIEDDVECLIQRECASTGIPMKRLAK
jgi:hypothetical protein